MKMGSSLVLLLFVGLRHPPAFGLPVPLRVQFGSDWIREHSAFIPEAEAFQACVEAYGKGYTFPLGQQGAVLFRLGPIFLVSSPDTKWVRILDKNHLVNCPPTRIGEIYQKNARFLHKNRGCEMVDIYFSC